jgi:hypothetical protein
MCCSRLLNPYKITFVPYNPATVYETMHYTVFHLIPAVGYL